MSPSGTSTTEIEVRSTGIALVHTDPATHVETLSGTMCDQLNYIASKLVAEQPVAAPAQRLGKWADELLAIITVALDGPLVNFLGHREYDMSWWKLHIVPAAQGCISINDQFDQLHTAAIAGRKLVELICKHYPEALRA